MWIVMSVVVLFLHQVLDPTASHTAAQAPATQRNQDRLSVFYFGVFCGRSGEEVEEVGCAVVEA